MDVLKNDVLQRHGATTRVLSFLILTIDTWLQLHSGNAVTKVKRKFDVGFFFRKVQESANEKVSVRDKTRYDTDCWNQYRDTDRFRNSLTLDFSQ